MYLLSTGSAENLPEDEAKGLDSKRSEASQTRRTKCAKKQMNNVFTVGEIITDMFLQNKTRLTDSYWKREDVTASNNLLKKERKNNG